MIERRNSTQAASGQHLSNGSALRDFLLTDYAERKFVATDPPYIEPKQYIALYGKTKGVDETMEAPICFLNLRAAKTQARRAIQAKPATWARRSRDERTWENKVAFETAAALQNLGAACFVGAIPLQYVMCFLSDVIIDDWLICRDWLASYRTNERMHFLGDYGSPASQGSKNLDRRRVKAAEQSVPKKATITKTQPKVHYHRRHGEWLMLVAILWTKKRWAYDNCDGIIRKYGGVSRIRDTLRYLSIADRDLMPNDVELDLRQLCGLVLK